MGSNVLSKLIISILIVMFAISMCTGSAYAMDPIMLAGAGGGSISGANFQLSQFDSGSTTVGGDIENVATDIIGAIIGVMRIVCVGIAIIMITMLAIKYISAAPGDRAEIKKSAIQYTVGAVILFGSAGILAILEKVVTGGFGLNS